MKDTTKSYHPLYPPSTSITIHNIQSHRRLHNYLRQLYRKNKRDFDFSPEIMTILEFVPHLCFVPCFLLAYTCCRVGELKQINISDLLQGKSIKIKSSKSKHIRSVPALPIFNPILLRSIDPKTMIIVVSYDHLKNSIRQAKKRGNLPSIENILDLTHIFRHYTATWMNDHGFHIDYISEKLGHLNTETTRKYIH